jgi:RNA polymerase sigma-70 factor (ECF subfamily)
MPASTNPALNGALEHWSAAYGLAALLVGDRSRAEDLCQEAFARLASMRREVTDPHRARPLILTIVRNLAAGEARRPAPTSLERHVESAGPLADPAAADPARLAEERETRQRVRDALARLDPLWRQMLYLKDGIGLRYAEIAEVTERSEDVVRVTLHRARRRVREALERTPIGRKEP